MTFTSFIESYGPTILYAVLTAIAGFLGACVKRIYERINADQTKKDVAETVVRAVEQMYKDLHGEEKKQKAIEGITEMLEAGVPAKMVQELADHHSLEMTQKYVGKSKSKDIMDRCGIITF